MRSTRFLTLLLVVLLGVGLICGGGVHSSLHGDGDAHGDAHGDVDCQVCHLSLDWLVEPEWLVGGSLGLAIGPAVAHADWVRAHSMEVGAPRGPPA